MKAMNLLKSKRVKKATRTAIIKKLDVLFSKAVRERDKVCQCCQKSNHIYTHHIFSRRHMGTRWDMDNAISLCVYCHRFKAHGDPEQFRDFILTRMPERKFLELKWKAYTPTKFTVNDLLFMLRAK